MLEETPLLIIDLQPCFYPTPDLVKEIETTSKKYKTIFQTKFEKKNTLFEDVLGFDPKSDDLALCLPNLGTVFLKYGYGLREENIQTILAATPKDHIHICGMEMDSSILATSF